MQLRDYQQRTIDQLYDWFGKHEGNPCIVMPTGSGKSHVVAALCRDALQSWPETRILMLTHVKELIQQNAEKMRLYWPNAPMGIYSASIGQKELGEPITFAGIQSIINRMNEIGHVDLAIIDECHMCNLEHTGSYRILLHVLQKVNPHLRVVGLTATPYRLGQGMITDEGGIFHGLIEPVEIMELVSKGHLSMLRSKHTDTQLDVTGVHKRGGEYIERELQAAVDRSDKNKAVVAEVIRRAEERKAWLFFCSGVDHATHIRDELRNQGVTAECVLGSTPKRARQEILEAFKAGEIRALTNANVLTTGFDYPDIDLIAMLRPTMSPGLYVQMAGRGMRPKSHTDHCLVLDFAGVVSMHGPITAVTPPKKAGKDGEAPVKVCPSCDELVHISVMECPRCGHQFEKAEKPAPKLHNDDIMGLDGNKSLVMEWRWRKHTSRASGKEMLAVTYHEDIFDPGITEYFPVLHDGYAGQKARQQVHQIAIKAGVQVSGYDDLDEIAKIMNNGKPPNEIEFRKDGSFYRVNKRSWDDASARPAGTNQLQSVA